MAVKAGVWRGEEQVAGKLSFKRLASSCLSGWLTSGSGYVHRRIQSMAISAREQGERKICGSYIRPPLALQSSVFVKITLGGHNNHV